LTTRFGIEHGLLGNERVTVRIVVTVLTAARLAAERSHLRVLGQCMARITVLFRMRAGQRQRRLRMQFGIEGVRREVCPLVATDAVLLSQRTVLELAAVWVLVARTAIIRTATWMTFGERSVCLVALRASQFVMWFGQSKASVLMVLGRHHEPRIVELLVVECVTEHTAGVSLQALGLRVTSNERLRVRRFVARSTSATLLIALRAQLLERMVGSQRVTRAAIQAAVRSMQRQPTIVTGNKALLERLLRVTRHACQLHPIAVWIAVTRCAVARQAEEALLPLRQNAGFGMFVTLGALEFSVRTRQLEAEDLVIELLRIGHAGLRKGQPIDQLEVAAMVLAVARRAPSHLAIGKRSVQAMTALDLGGNVLVALVAGLLHVAKPTTVACRTGFAAGDVL